MIYTQPGKYANQHLQRIVNLLKMFGYILIKMDHQINDIKTMYNFLYTKWAELTFLPQVD